MAKSGRERLPDVYYSLDYRVLLKVGRWELVGRPDGFLEPERVAQQLGGPPGKVQAAVGRLIRLGHEPIRPRAHREIGRRRHSTGVTGLRDADGILDSVPHLR